MRSLVFWLFFFHGTFFVLPNYTCSWHLWGGGKRWETKQSSLFGLHGCFHQNASGLFSSKLNIKMFLLFHHCDATRSQDVSTFLFISCFTDLFLNSSAMTEGRNTRSVRDWAVSVMFFYLMGCSSWVNKNEWSAPFAPSRFLFAVSHDHTPNEITGFYTSGIYKVKTTPLTCC